MEEVKGQKNTEQVKNEPPDYRSSNNKEESLTGGSNTGSCVYFAKEAFQFIDDHSRNNKSEEAGGFLLGNYTGDKGNFRVWVETAVLASHTEADREGIRLTHRTWEHLKEEKDKYYPEYRIVGWFHVCPGKGTIIQEQDMFIHEMFFDSFMQITYIIDPLSREHAFFGWDRYDQISAVSFKLEGEPLYVALNKEERLLRKKNRRKKKKNNSILSDAGKIGIPLASALLFFYFFNNYYLLPPFEEKIKELETSVVTKEQTIVSLQTDIDDITKEPEVPEGIAEQDKPEEIPEPVEPDPSETETDTEQEPEPSENGEDSSLRTYTVTEGDTLWSISVQFLGDGSRHSELAELNNVSSSQNLKPGTVLKIPDN